MKKAFTLIELIFAILIIGILAGIGLSSFKQDYLHKDTEFVLLKIKEAHFKAMGHDGFLANGCITVTQNDINKAQIDNNESSPYRIHSTITATSLTNNLLCFDSLGRPHNGNAYTSNTLNMSNLINNFTDITLTFNSKNCIIRVYPLSGYGIIRCR